MNGLSESSLTTYVPDTTTACCDATGTVIKYYQNTVYPAGNETSPAYGRVVCQYLNGNLQLNGDNYYDMMDGLMSSVSCYNADGALVASQANSWIAYSQRAGSPVDAGVAPKQLYGAYVLAGAQLTIRDGVSSSQTYNYIPDTFQFSVYGKFCQCYKLRHKR